MSIHSLTTGLLADMDGFGFLIFFLVAFFSWLMNALSPKDPNKKNQRRPQNAGDRGKKVQSEIDRFLQQAREMVDPKNQQREQQADPFRAEPQSTQTRAAPPPERRRRSPQEFRQTSSPGPQNQKRSKPQSAQKPKKNNSPSTLADRHLKTSNTPLSAGLPSSMPDQVSGHGGLLNSESVFQKPLSQTSSEERNSETLSNRNNAAMQLARKMRTPLQVRDAIMMNEVLNRPLALRSRGKNGRTDSQFP